MVAKAAENSVGRTKARDRLDYLGRSRGIVWGNAMKKAGAYVIAIFMSCVAKPKQNSSPRTM
jgi:hypothetical protein